MIKRLLLSLLLLSMVLVAAACSDPVSGEVLKSDKERDSSPNVSQSDLNNLARGNSQFAFDLYQAIRDAEGNLFYSPYSISLALAMTYAGASGNTENQMTDTLRFLLSQDKLHPAFNYLDIELNSRGKGASGKDGDGFELNIVNAIWGQNDYEFLDSFLDVLAENYGAGLQLMDFIADAEAARIEINDWVSENTEGRIDDLIPQGAIDALTRLVLTNAIYFNAAWASPFDEELTYDGPFYLLNGDQINIPIMQQTEYLGYTSGDGYQAVELPYDGLELSMVILAPDRGGFEQFESLLSAQTVADIIGDLESTNVALSMPKFSFEAELDLKGILATMGMVDAFDPWVADFSGIDGTQQLFITDVFHKAFVDVDEAGTEAAAATAVIVGLTAMPEGPIEVSLDQPFIFLIKDIKTDTILFVGRIINPAS